MVYEVNIFLTNRHLPIPEVLPSERLLVEQKGACGFYHVIARYGCCLQAMNVYFVSNNYHRSWRCLPASCAMEGLMAPSSASKQRSIKGC